MENIKISVIMSVYNVENYLEEALDSILNQSIIDDIEVLMIDDGSIDNSKYIVEKYALDYSNFHAYHNPNCGQGCERNYGLSLAKGEYIHFMDADDYIVSDFYEKMYGFAKSDDYDFVLCNTSKYTKNSIWKDILFKTGFKGIKEDFLTVNIKDNHSLIYDTIIANKLIRKDFILENNISFIDEKILYEDILFTMNLYCYADSVGLLNEDKYYWRYRDNLSSSTQQFNTINNFKDRFKILKLMNDFMIDENVDGKIKNETYKKWLNHDLKMFIKRINKYDSSDYEFILNDVCDFINEFPMELFDYLNSYKKIIYKMLRNKDIDSLLFFAPLEDNLKADHDLFYSIDEKYHDLIDLAEDYVDEDLKASLHDVKIEDGNLAIYIKSFIPYLSNPDFNNFKFKLFESDDDYTIEIQSVKKEDLDNFYLINSWKTDEKNIFKLLIPLNDFNLLKSKNNIFVFYDDGIVKKEAIVKTNKRKRTLTIGDYEFILTYGVYRNLYLFVEKLSDETLNIVGVFASSHSLSSDLNYLSSGFNSLSSDSDSGHASDSDSFLLDDDFNFGFLESVDDNIVCNFSNKFNTLEYEDESFINLIGVCDKEIDYLILENLVTFKQFKYETELITDFSIGNLENFNSPEFKEFISSNKDNFIFCISIPFSDIFSSPITKWQIKVENNAILQIKKPFKYVDNKIKINIQNNGNKLFVIAQYMNKLNEIKLLNSRNEKNKLKNSSLQHNNKIANKKLEKLNLEKKKLLNQINELNIKNQNLEKINKDLILDLDSAKKKNQNLKDEITAFKSRKIVRFADSIKKL